MAEIITPQTAAQNSANIVLTTGQSVTLTLKRAPGGVPLPQLTWAEVQKQTTGGDWETFGYLTASQKVLVLQAAGTFRVSKPVTSVAAGVDSD